MVVVPIDRSGSTLNLTEAEYSEARELAQSSLQKKGSLIPFYGRSENVRKYGSFLVTEAERKSYIQEEKAFQSQLKSQGYDIQTNKEGFVTGISKSSGYLMTTKEGVRDIRTGKIVAPVSSSVGQASVSAERQYQSGIKAREKIMRSIESQQVSQTQEQRKGFFQKLRDTERKVYSYLESKTPGYSSIPGIDTKKAKTFAAKKEKELADTDLTWPPSKEYFQYLGYKGVKYLPESFGGAALRGTEIVGVGYGGKIALMGVGKITSAVYFNLPKQAQFSLRAAGKGTEVYFFGSGIKESRDTSKTTTERLLGITTAAISGTGFASSGIKYAPDIKYYLTRKEVQAESLILKDVLSGKKKFVESYSYGYKGYSSGQAKREFDIKVFQKYGKGYHATPSPITSNVIGESTSEFQGLYIAPSVSPYFLKLTKNERTIEFSFFPSITRPKILQIAPTKFVKGFRSAEGEAFVPGIKPEIEAIIPTGTKLKKLTSKEYFRYGGRNIPIDIYETIGGEKSLETKIINKKFIKSYSYAPKSQVSLSSYFSGSLMKFYLPSSRLIYSQRSSLGRYVGNTFAPSFKGDFYSQSQGQSKISQSSSFRKYIKETIKTEYTRNVFSSIRKSLSQSTFRPRFDFSFGLKEASKGRREFFPQPKAYQPTFTALALNIKAFKVPKAYKYGAGGIIQRPIITKRGKRR